ncbi:hypothetical protein RHSP_74315 (plasmid) [Rhizobium freirei PRF 81]|uniref:Uncharacterized protein n=2 Tax=Rhizobium TaxID=379 RepID=N6USB0_9HYPH|nr:hypothetical protein [Rhizobium freirei]ENN83706.1 hypothetical protein RHSP_74315 [Rhizobium freirei PRF 81]MDK4741757.1 hypothetical protein [Rhizobium sp. CNPSo 3464]
MLINSTNGRSAPELLGRWRLRNAILDVLPPLCADLQRLTGFMLPRVLLNPVYRFLLSVDRCISYEVSALKRADENGVTDRLLWCLNANGEPVPNIEFSIDDLKRDVRQLVGEGFPIGVEFKTERYTQNYEGDVTQADYGLNINFTDPSQINPAMKKWTATYFMQSKVAKVPPDSDQWDLRASFSRTSGQPNAIDRLRSLVGNRGLLYHLYCPSGALRYASSSKLFKTIEATGVNKGAPSVYWRSGFWLTHTLPTNMKTLFANRVHPTPWTLLILSHFFNLRGLDGLIIEPERLYEGQKNEEAQFREDLFKRDPKAVESAYLLKIADGQPKREIVESYLKAQPHRTVTMDITFPTYEYEKSMQPDIAPDDGDIPDFEREAEDEHDNNDGLSNGIKLGGTGCL